MISTAILFFFGFALWEQARATGAELVWRVKSNLRLPCTQALADGSYLSRIDLSRKHRRHAGGAGILVLEEYERAKARGAKIYGEIVGYAANSDGFDMVAPSGEGAARCMKLAMQDLGGRRIDYLNPHGTGTPVGDVKEMEAVRAVFGETAPLISSTKSLTGHSLGAAGAQEAIYSLLMLNNGFVAESAHIENLDPAFEGMPIVRKREDRELETVMSNSFGFGGTNGCLVMAKAS